MKTLLTIADILLILLTFAMLIGFVLGLFVAIIPYSLIAPELGWEGVHLQINGLKVAGVSFLGLAAVALFRAYFDR